jgi:hypothetical protein
LRKLLGRCGMHAELTLCVQAEESGGAWVESQAFQGMRKRGLSGAKSLLRGIRALADFGVHGQLQTGVSVCYGGAKRERGHQEVEAGLGPVGPEAEAALGYLSE